MLYKGDGVSPVLPVKTFLCDITVIALTSKEALKLKSGQVIDSKRFLDIEDIAAACFEDELIALVAPKDNYLKPIRVFNL